MPTKIRVQRERVVNVFDNLKEPRFKNATFEAGVIDENATYPDGTRVIDVATWNEFGTSKIPARAALRRSISRMTPKLIMLGREQAKDMMLGKLRFDVAARRMASLLAEDMKKAVESFRTPPNAPSTVAKKGFNNPLIETRLYVRTIGYRLFKTRKGK